VANIGVELAGGLSARDVMHAQTSALDPRTTVAQARAYFAASTSRRLAIVARDGRYVAALTPADLDGADDGDPARPAIELAPPRPTVGPQASATLARDLAAATDTRRVPVVDDDGRYLGIVSLNRGLEWFCGTG
jgi:CBS domain-containing protein